MALSRPCWVAVLMVAGIVAHGSVADAAAGSRVAVVAESPQSAGEIVLSEKSAAGPVFSIARTAVADGAPASGASLEVRAGDVAVARFDANDTMAVSSRLLVKGRDVLGELDVLASRADATDAKNRALEAENTALRGLVAAMLVNDTAIAAKVKAIEDDRAAPRRRFGPKCFNGAAGYQDMFALDANEYGLWWATGNGYGGSALVFIHNNGDTSNRWGGNPQLTVLASGGDASGYTWSHRLLFHDGKWYVQSDHNQDPHTVCMTYEAVYLYNRDETPAV